MVDRSLIPSIKKSCLGIGLRRKGEPTPLHMGGTGFIVDPKGYVVTADHVILDLMKLRDELNSKGDNVEIAGFLLSLSNGVGNLIGSSIKKIDALYIEIEGLEDYIPQEHDLAVCRIYGKWGTLPYLQVKKPTKLEIYEEVLMCGYPRGDFTMNIFDKKFGKRISPIIQTGRISSLMPADNTRQPIGIQTDIVGTAGSSGSPIINANDGEVIGIAQRVVPSLVMNLNGNPIGSSLIGLVWGISFYFVYDGLYRMIEAMKEEVDEKGEPLPGKSRTFKITFTAGEGSFPDFQSASTKN